VISLAFIPAISYLVEIKNSDEKKKPAEEGEEVPVPAVLVAASGVPNFMFVCCDIVFNKFPLC
jgi:hypothetical protein